jgi:hypothetical protein
MSLKDAAERAAVLDTLHKAIGEELKAAKRDLEAGLRAAKAETGTQKVAISLDGRQDIGTASLVQPAAVATVTEPEKFKAWVLEHFAGEIKREFVTSVQPAFQKKLLDQVGAAGVAQWADPETGEIHAVPGVEMQGRAAYTRMTVPDAGKQAIAAAWQSGALSHVVLPQLGGGGAE